MVLQARLMITGGEHSEEARMGRADRYLIQQAILDAAHTAQAKGLPHPRAEDVAHALMAMRNDTELGAGRQARAEEMGQAMMVFCDGLRGKLFNRYGESWPNADVTLVEMGTLAQEGYEDALSLAYTSLVSHVQALAETTHYEGRPIIFLTDEATSSPRTPCWRPTWSRSPRCGASSAAGSGWPLRTWKTSPTRPGACWPCASGGFCSPWAATRSTRSRASGR